MDRLLRHAEGGSQSGFGPLTLLPVVWLALYGRRRQLIAALSRVAKEFERDPAGFLIGRNSRGYEAE